jgi:hypothetical protein
MVLREVEFAFGPPEKRASLNADGDFEYAVAKLKESLVDASVFERRGTLFTVVSNMERQWLDSTDTVQWKQVEQYCALIRQWVEWAEWGLTPESPRRPKDPLAPRQRPF